MNLKSCSSPFRNVLAQGWIRNQLTEIGGRIRVAWLSTKCNVIISKDDSIYSNLALENWLYTNLRFADHKDGCTTKTRNKSKPLMLIWRNNPALVIGRHQNPWLEGRISQVNRYHIELARRQSGGGCVYHDMNNINISLIGHKDLFSQRQNNLRFVAKFIYDLYGIQCEPTQRHDLVISDTGFKITGSAAKLGQFNCYHHFTLLVNTDTNLLYKVIRQEVPDYLETKSSSSVRSRVQNLKEVNNDLNPEIIVRDLALYFSKTMEKQPSPPTADKDSTIRLVQPNDSEFPGYDKMRQDLMQWNWIFGMTPRFTLKRDFEYIDFNKEQKVYLEVEVVRGLIERITFRMNDGEQLSFFDDLLGDQFTYENFLRKLAKLFQVDEENLNPGANDNRKLLFATFLMQLVNDLFT